jgi:hypothetical protein
VLQACHFPVLRLQKEVSRLVGMTACEASLALFKLPFPVNKPKILVTSKGYCNQDPCEQKCQTAGREYMLVSCRGKHKHNSLRVMWVVSWDFFLWPQHSVFIYTGSTTYVKEGSTLESYEPTTSLEQRPAPIYALDHYEWIYYFKQLWSWCPSFNLFHMTMWGMLKEVPDSEAFRLPFSAPGCCV